MLTVVHQCDVASGDGGGCGCISMRSTLFFVVVVVVADATGACVAGRVKLLRQLLQLVVGEAGFVVSVCGRQVAARVAALMSKRRAPSAAVTAVLTR